MRASDLAGIWRFAKKLDVQGAVAIGAQRKRGRGAHQRAVGRGTHTVQHLRRPGESRVWLRERTTRAHVDDQATARVESRVNGSEARETLNEPSGACDQCDR